MLEVKAFRRDKVVRIQCEDEDEFNYLVEGLQDKDRLLRLAHDLPYSPLASAIYLLGRAKLRVPPGGDHDVWETS